MGGVLIISVWVLAAASLLSLEGLDGQRQNSAQTLEYLMNVLEQRGLLGKVNPSLLHRLRNVTQDQSEQSDILTKLAGRRPKLPFRSRKGLSVSKPVSILDRAKSRVQNSEFRSADERFQSSQRISSLKNHNVGDECQALKTENRILKQILSELTTEKYSYNKQKIHPLTSLDIFGKIQASPRKPDVLQQLLHSTSTKQKHPEDKPILNLLYQAKRDLDTLLITSVLITPTPAITTTITTTSYETTEVFNRTEEIPILFRGRTILTTVIEPISQVMTTTEVLTTTVKITPTPSWETVSPVSIGPLPFPQQRNLRDLLDQTQKRSLPIQNLNQQEPSQLDHFQSFQNLLSKLQKKAQSYYQDKSPEVKTQIPIHSQVPIQQVLLSIPITETTTVITQYISGSVPGEYSTKLQTLVVGPDGEFIERRKRDVLSHIQNVENPDLINPTRVLSIQATKQPHVDYIDWVNEEKLQNQLEVVQSSIFHHIQAHMLQIVKTQTLHSTVTVTITEKHGQNNCITQLQ